MSVVTNLRVGIYLNQNCIGRDYVSGPSVLVSTIYDESIRRFETMVFNAGCLWENDVSFDTNEISVMYYSNREDAINGHRSHVNSWASSIG